MLLRSGGISMALTQDNTEVEEYYYGAAWSPDSTKVYFAKQIEIRISEAQLAELQGRFLDDLKVGRPLPDLSGFEKPLLKTTSFFEYDMAKKRLREIKNVDSLERSTLYFRSVLVKDELQFHQVERIRSLNLRSGALGVPETSDGPGSFSQDQVFAIVDTERSPLRYFSPDRHSFLELGKIYPPPPSLLTRGYRLGFFTDPRAQMKTWEELGWQGGIPDARIAGEVSRYQPQYFLDLDQARSAEEKAIRVRLEAR